VAFDALGALGERADRAGVFLDFDGSLSAIVPHPDEAHPVAVAREALAALVPRFRVVAVVSGREAEDVEARLAVPGVLCVGLYGMQDAAPDLSHALLPAVIRAASGVPEAWVEDKRVSLAVHYRRAPDPVVARAALSSALRPIVAGRGLALVEGKMVIELVPADRPMKGGTLKRLVEQHGLEAALFAGDDVADLDAFAALDDLRARGLRAVKVAVRGPETPDALTAASDVGVDGPEGLVELLRSLGSD